MRTCPRNSKRLALLLSFPVFLIGCVTTTGNYVVTAANAQGKPLNTVFHVQGRHIYTARNGICAAHPGAVVTIRTRESGQELEGESPYTCR